MRFKREDHLDPVREHVEPPPYLEFSFLENIGWKEPVTGVDGGIIEDVHLPVSG